MDGCINALIAFQLAVAVAVAVVVVVSIIIAYSRLDEILSFSLVILVTCRFLVVVVVIVFVLMSMAYLAEISCVGAKCAGSIHSFSAISRRSAATSSSL